MEVAVKWVYQEVRHKGIPIEAGQKPSLCFRGRKFMLAVAAGYPVRVFKRPVIAFDKSRTVVHQGAEYTIARAIRQLEDIAGRNGITEKAKRLLAKAKEGLESQVDEDEFEDEEGVVVEQPKPGAATEADSSAATAEEKKSTTTEGETTMATGKKKTAAKKTATKKTVKKATAAKATKRAAKVTMDPKTIGDIVAAVVKKVDAEKKAHDGKLPRGAKRKILTEVADKFGVKRRNVRAALREAKGKKKGGE